MDTERSNRKSALIGIIMLCAGLVCLWFGIEGLLEGSATSASRYVNNPIESTAQPGRFWYSELYWFGLGLYLVLKPIIDFMRRR